MSEECSSCKKQINNSDSKKTVSCPTCEAKYHSFCVIIKNKKWNCVKCSTETSSTSGNIKDEENVILKAIEDFRKENQASWLKNDERWDKNDAKFSKLQADIEGTKLEIKKIEDSVEKVTKKCETSCQTVEEMRRENELLKEMLSDLQQHTRKNNLIVSGVPFTFKEDMFVVTQAIANALHVDFHYSEINAAHRLQSKRGDPRPPSIVISFTSRLTKNLWISARRQKGSLSARDLNSSFLNTPVYINEHLTPQTRELFNATRKMVKEKILSSAWTMDCKVMAKSAPDQHPFRVRDLNQVTALREKKAAAAAPPPSPRAHANADTAATKETPAATKSPPTPHQTQVPAAKKQ